MSSSGKRIVLFLGAGAVQHLGYKTTREFYQNINNNPSYKNDVLWNVLIKSDIVTDIEIALRVLEIIISIYDKNDDEYSFIRSPDWSIYNMTNKTYEMCNIPDKLDLDFYYRFLERFYGIDMPQTYFLTLERFIQDVRTLKGMIQNSIIQEYGTDVESKKIMTLESLINLLITQSSDLSIFTTNYENSVRRVIGLANVVDDGFDTNHQFNPRGNTTQQNNKQSVTYNQLHGSLKWVRLPGNIIRNDPESNTFGNTRERIIIYPTLTLKTSQYESEPHKYYYNQFQKKMKEADICIVIGFSFRDQMSEFFSKFDGNLFIIDKVDNNIPNAFEKYIEQLKENNVKINIKKIEKENVFLKGFPQYDDGLFRELLKKINQSCKINLKML